jgi:hypothetical protein
MKTAVFWDITPRGPATTRALFAACFMLVSCGDYSLNLKEAKFSSEMWVDF